MPVSPAPRSRETPTCEPPAKRLRSAEPSEKSHGAHESSDEAIQEGGGGACVRVVASPAQEPGSPRPDFTSTASDDNMDSSPVLAEDNSLGMGVGAMGLVYTYGRGSADIGGDPVEGGEMEGMGSPGLLPHYGSGDADGSNSKRENTSGEAFSMLADYDDDDDEDEDGHENKDEHGDEHEEEDKDKEEEDKPEEMEEGEILDEDSGGSQPNHELKQGKESDKYSGISPVNQTGAGNHEERIADPGGAHPDEMHVNLSPRNNEDDLPPHLKIQKIAPIASPSPEAKSGKDQVDDKSADDEPKEISEVREKVDDSEVQGKGDDAEENPETELSTEELESWLPEEYRQEPLGEVNPDVQDTIQNLLDFQLKQKVFFNEEIMVNKQFRNPCFLTKMSSHFGINEFGTQLSSDIFDPKNLPKEDMAEGLRAERHRRASTSQATPNPNPSGRVVAPLSAPPGVQNAILQGQRRLREKFTSMAAGKVRVSKWDTGR